MGSRLMRNSEKAYIFSHCKSGLKNCSHEWRDQCLKLKITAIKAIRMHLYLAERLWKLDPDIYIIHYVRDPRGTMRSRNALKKYNNLTFEAERLCQRLSSNHQYGLKLARDFPTRFLQVRYEDLALNTTLFVNKLYSFLGANVPESLLNWLDKNTHTKKGHTFGTSRMSAETATKWQSALGVREKEIINSVCSSELKQLGYEV